MTNSTLPTAAWKKADEYRDMMHSDNDGKLIGRGFTSVVYLSENKERGCFYACGYAGKSKKPAFNYMFRSEENRRKSVNTWMNKLIERKAERRKTQERTLKVGDVLKSVWGYEQTNIDYYMVTKLVGKTSVQIVEIGAMTQETDWMQGKCIPNKNNIIGEPMTKRADGDRVRIASYTSASKIEPTIIAGAEIYNTDHYTAYH